MSLLPTLSSVSHSGSVARSVAWSHNGLVLATAPLHVMWSSSFIVTCCVYGESIACHIEAAQGPGEHFELVLPDEFMARTRFVRDSLRCCALVRYSATSEFNSDVWRAIELEPVDTDAMPWQYPLCSYCSSSSRVRAVPRPSTHQCQLCRQFACAHCWSSSETQ